MSKVVGALQNVRRILVIQLGPFGDGLLTTSYFASLKKAFPFAQLHYLIKEPYHRSVIRHPLVDKLVTIPRHNSFSGDFVERIKVLRTLRRERYDLVIDSQNKPSSQYLTLLSGAGIRLGYDHRRWMSWVYNLRASKGRQRYQASMRFDILKPLGIEEEPFQLYFPIPDEDQAYIDQWLEQEALARQKFVVISPGSRQERKKWRTDYYAEVADRIQVDLGLPVVLLWAPEEWPDVEYLSKQMQTSALIAPPTTLEQGVALLNRCRLLLCNDSGLNHMSVTTSTPTLAMFGPMNPVQWSPASAFPHHHHLHVPGGATADDNSFGITPAMVYEKVQAILGEAI